MTSLLEGARKRMSRRGDLADRVSALAEAVEASRGRLDDELVDRSAGVVERASARLRLSAEHTVVALAGATGSGKSSTFNALAALDLAAVGVRRPTTSWATACIWGENGAGELLAWLGIPLRHQVVRDSMLDVRRDDDDLHGLVLLDLPDHDSTEVSHHLEVDRLVELADLMVWILDPQKYADAAIHDRFLRPLAAHREVMLVVLNHIDEVEPDRREGLLADVRRLVDADGLQGVPVLAMSARTGEGVADLRRAIAARVADKATTRHRIETDVRQAAEQLAFATGAAEPPALGRPEKSALIDAVADAAGVPLVVDAVRDSTARRARHATGWPLVSWVARLRPDPLKRLKIDLAAADRDLVASARSSLPRADKIQQARVDARLRDLADSVAGKLAKPWAQAVRQASLSRSAELGDRLDRAITSTDLGVRRLPLWCRLVRMLQWVLIVGALGGGLWLAALAAHGFLQQPERTAPKIAGVAVPTVLLVGGLGLGLLLAVLSRLLVGVGARARARRAERRLRAAIDQVTEELVVAPIEHEVAAYATAREGLRQALG
jgi:GTP-binding protein EngB required for normal cell division